MLHRIEASINLQALQHNFAVARQYALGKGHSKVVAMIKANAYGHGLIPVAESLAEADVFGVTDTQEAELLYQAGCHKPIVIVQGLISGKEDAALVVSRGYQCVIHRLEDLQLLEAACKQYPPTAPLTLWLKLDSGMGRLGLSLTEFSTLNQSLKQQPWVGTVVLMTHLASSSEPLAALNTQQLHTFAEAVRDQQQPTSIAASAGLLALDAPSDYVRPGIMLYGSSPFPWTDTKRRREHFELEAVMTLRARLISIRDHQAGDNIGYNSQYICERPMRVGIVSCGYADGYPSTTPNGCPVLVGNQRSATLGRVSMDMLAVDLSGINEPHLEMPVTLWGASLSLDEVAAHTGILSYNLTCSVATRVPKHYV